MNIIRAAFPDFHNEIEAIIAEGEHAAARLTYIGTHEGELLGIAAARQKVSYAGAAFFTFHDNRIAKVWVLGDALSLMRQIGAIARQANTGLRDALAVHRLTFRKLS